MIRLSCQGNELAFEQLLIHLSTHAVWQNYIKIGGEFSKLAAC